MWLCLPKQFQVDQLVLGFLGAVLPVERPRLGVVNSVGIDPVVMPRRIPQQVDGLLLLKE